MSSVSESPEGRKPSIAAHLRSYQVPPTSYSEFFILSTDKITARSRLVASTAVIHSGRVLLLQRAAHGFQPLLWELPGGRCEAHDKTVIASATRELWEESGLEAHRVLDIVGEYEWIDKGERWKKITFLAAVDGKVEQEEDINARPKVTIDPEEQEDYIWATEEEVLAGQCGDTPLNWTSEDQRQMVLNAFRLLK